MTCTFIDHNPFNRDSYTIRTVYRIEFCYA